MIFLLSSPHNKIIVKVIIKVKQNEDLQNKCHWNQMTMTTLKSNSVKSSMKDQTINYIVYIYNFIRTCIDTKIESEYSENLTKIVSLRPPILLRIRWKLWLECLKIMRSLGFSRGREGMAANAGIGSQVHGSCRWM